MTTMHIALLKISLTIKGPFLTHSSAPLDYGIDAALARNQNSKPYLPGTLLMGKLREAWLELSELGVKAFKPDIIDWLGQKSDPSQERLESTVLPKPKRLYINDLVLKNTLEKSDVNYRIRIDPKRGAVEQGAYLVSESPFAPGTQIMFEGTARFLARDETEAENLTRDLKIGLKWLSQLGANRTVGFGELIGVEVERETLQPFDNTESDSFSRFDTYDLIIHPESAFCISEHHIAGNNLFKSSSLIPGGVIKGTLATLWTTLLGKKNTLVDKNLDSERQALGEYFEKIQISHAFPGTQQIRPIEPPLSLVKADELYDVALCEGAGLINGQAPAFAVDWKSETYAKVNELFGKPEVKREVRVRTQIDYKTRRSAEEQLFAYEMVVPTDNLAWYARLDLSEVPDKARPNVVKQLRSLIAQGVLGLSKTKAYAQVELLPPNTLSPSQPSNLEKRDGVWIVTLQTPALLCDPDVLMATDKTASERLHHAYATVFAELSDNSLELVRFFATQSLAGGFYLWKRFQTDQPYQPYLLTKAGSVFVLQPKQRKERAAKKFIEKWAKSALPLPKWAREKYKQGEQESTFLEKWDKSFLPLPKWIKEKYEWDDLEDTHWSNCPYIPQNGYGEIAVNLSIHSDRHPKEKFVPI